MTVHQIWRWACDRCGLTRNTYASHILPSGWDRFITAKGEQHWCEECCSRDPREWEFFEDAEPPDADWQGTKLPKEGREILRKHKGK